MTCTRKLITILNMMVKTGRRWSPALLARTLTFDHSHLSGFTLKRGEQLTPTKLPLAADDMENERFASTFVVAIDDPAGWFDDLAVTGASEFANLSATLGMMLQLVSVLEHTRNKVFCGLGVFESDVVSDCV